MILRFLKSQGNSILLCIAEALRLVLYIRLVNELDKNFVQEQWTGHSAVI